MGEQVADVVAVVSKLADGSFTVEFKNDLSLLDSIEAASNMVSICQGKMLENASLLLGLAQPGGLS